MQSIRRIIPASFVRGGTSKGIFLLRSSLPADESLWPGIFRRIMGSPDPYGRQLDGMGGGISSLSKIIVVSLPSKASFNNEIDVEYLFVQVGIKDGEIDISGNCGNLSSMVGVFAVDQGLIPPSQDAHGRMRIRSWNINTQKRVDTTFPIVPLRNGVLIPDVELPELEMAGVPNRASRISLEFIDPAGARTGKLLPSGNTTDFIPYPNGGLSSGNITVSLVDAANPTVFVDHAELCKAFGATSLDFVSTATLDVLEAIRRSGAVLMGLDPAAQAQPKIALVGLPASGEDSKEDIVIHALSMGALHKAVPMTVGLCLGVAATTPGTIVERLVKRRARRRDDPEIVTMRHPSGLVDVGAKMRSDGTVESAKVLRTGRTMMVGKVWC